METNELLELLLADAILTRAFQAQMHAAGTGRTNEEFAAFIKAHPITDYLPEALAALQATRTRLWPTSGAVLPPTA